MSEFLHYIELHNEFLTWPKWKNHKDHDKRKLKWNRGVRLTKYKYLWNHDSVSHVPMSGGKLFLNWAPAVAKVLSPTVARCDWWTSSWWVSDDCRRRLDSKVRQHNSMLSAGLQVCSQIGWCRAVQWAIHDWTNNLESLHKLSTCGLKTRH